MKKRVKAVVLLLTVAIVASLSVGTGFAFAMDIETNDKLGYEPIEIVDDTNTGNSKYDISQVEISLSDTNYIQNGEEAVPEVIVKGLTLNEDYEVEYGYNKSAGVVTVTVKGINQYTGIKTITFNVEEHWKTVYKKMIRNWKQSEKYYKANSKYLKFYFGKDYKFDKYFLCDVDGNGVPELFLYSTKMRLSTVFTYSEGKLKCLGNDAYYKVNKVNHELVVKGHWHGAGGTGKYEWHTYKLVNGKLNPLFNIDKEDMRYWRVWNSDYKIIGKSKATWQTIYDKHCKTGTRLGRYKRYDLSNPSRIDSY